MAQIVNRAGRKIFLNRYHIFGRDPLISSTILNSKACSNLHAAIFFEDNNWYIEDRSINGVVINNNLIHNKKVPLKSIKKIRFCVSEKEEWFIEDLSPPCSYLQKVNDNSIYPLNKETPVTINNEEFHLIKKGSWRLKNNDATISLKSGQKLLYKGDKYRFVLNESLNDTIVLSNYIPDFSITFELSENYEFVNVFIKLNGTMLKLCNNSYNFIWYLLAKKVKRDMFNNHNCKEVGWVNNEDLLGVLNKECKQNFDIYYLNLQIHRIRKRLLKIDPKCDVFFNNLIQRRKGQIRMNTTQIMINEPNYQLYA